MASTVELVLFGCKSIQDEHHNVYKYIRDNSTLDTVI